MACGNRTGASGLCHGLGRHAVRDGSILRLSPRLVLRQTAVASDLMKPARRVAIDDQLLVVDARVAVQPDVAQAVHAQGRWASLGGA